MHVNVFYACPVKQGLTVIDCFFYEIGFFFLPDSVELCMLSITFVDIFLSELSVHEYVFN